MLVLDTNVLAVMMGSAADPQVMVWLGKQPAKDLFTTAISQAEIFAGLAIMPPGRRCRDLEGAVKRMFENVFEGQVLASTTEAASHYGDIFAIRRKVGRPISTADLLIAAKARARGAAVVARDVGGFEGCGIDLVNLWRSQ
jgi:predicted nucleic acid-binding protein